MRPKKKKVFVKGPLPEQVVYMAAALDVIDNLETDTGRVSGAAIAEQTGIALGTLGVLLGGLSLREIIVGRTGRRGGYRRLRETTLRELCEIISHRYTVEDPGEWGANLEDFHERFRVLIEDYKI